MAGKIKGITIEFNGDTTKLNKALREVKGETKNIDRSLKDVNRALKFNPKSTELLAQKQKLLKDKIEATKNQLKQFKNAQSQLDSNGVDKNSQEYMKLRREIITTKSKLDHFNKELKKTSRVKLNQLGGQFKKVGSAMRNVGVKMSIVSGALAFAGKQALDAAEVQVAVENKLVEIYEKRMGATEAAAKSTMNLASKMQEYGVIGDEVTLSGAQQLATFAKMPGTVDSLLPAMGNLLAQQKGYKATAEDATNIANLMGKAMMGQTGALTRVGISFSEAQEKILKYGTEEEKAATLAQVITDNVGEMNKKLAETPHGQIQQAKNNLGDMAEKIGVALAPAVSGLAKLINEYVIPAINGVVTFCQEHPIIAKIIVGITALMAVLGPILICIGSLVSAIGVLTPIIGAISLPVLAVIAVITALIAIGVALYKNWDVIKEKASAIWEGMKSIVGSVVDAIKNKVSSAFNAIKNNVSNIFNAIKNTVSSVFNGIKGIAVKVWNGVKNAITTPIVAAKNKVKSLIDRIKSFFGGLRLRLPKIKLPHLNISGGFSIAPPRVPKFSIDWYKHGGIMMKPTVFGMNGNNIMAGGEAGPEAIAPINVLQKYVVDAVSDAIGNTNKELINELKGLNQLLTQYIPQLSNTNVVLDTGAMVGAMVPGMDMALGRRQLRKERG